jgi:hypothetical protein
VIDKLIRALMAQQQEQDRPGDFMPDPRLLGRDDLFRGGLDTQIYQPQAVPPASVNDPAMQLDPGDVAQQMLYGASQRRL